jgi:hypothetical protein
MHTDVQNFISQSALRDITGLRQDFFNALSSLGFIASPKALQSVNVNSSNHNLVKAIIVGGLYPRVARIALPTAQFERLQQGTIQKDHHAKEVKFFDQNGRVFLHPTSILFAEAGGLKSGFVTYFAKAETSKVFLRDATEVPLFALLLFGGPITVQHFAGGVMLGKDGFIKLRANTRIAVLCSQLRYASPALTGAFPFSEADGAHPADVSLMRSWRSGSRAPMPSIYRDMTKWLAPCSRSCRRMG